MRRRTLLTGLAAAGIAAGCSSADPFAGESKTAALSSAPPGMLVVGSQDYYSNEIVAELYAIALEKAGFKVSRQLRIGQREAYLPELRDGKIDVFAEYGGNLLQFLNKSTTARDAAQIQRELAKALPQGLRVLKPAEATDQDSYTVTKDFAARHSLTSIADLAKLDGLKIAANSELAKRAYGPEGVKRAYGVDIELVPVEDSGGPLTVRALTDGTVQVADIYTADPAIDKNGLVTLHDPKGLILPQHTTPVVSRKVDGKAATVIEAVNARLTTDELRSLNARSVGEQRKAAEIADGWLKSKGLV